MKLVHLLRAAILISLAAAIRCSAQLLLFLSAAPKQSILTLLPPASLNVKEQKDQPGENVHHQMVVGWRRKNSELVGDESVGSFFPKFF